MRTLYIVRSRDKSDFLFPTYDKREAEIERNKQEKDEEMAGGRPSVWIQEVEAPAPQMKLEMRITGTNKQRFQENLEAFVNLACLISLKGTIPTPEDIRDANRMGRWWYRDSDRFQLLGIANNDWLNIRDEGETYMDVEFNYRYDIQSARKKTITALMIAIFDFVSIIP